MLVSHAPQIHGIILVEIASLFPESVDIPGSQAPHRICW